MANLLRWFHPLYDAIFTPSIPFSFRWRLLVLQPFALLTYSMKWLPWMFSSAYTVYWIPTRRNPGHSVRAIVFQLPPKPQAHEPNEKLLRPLHLDFHGGGFLGGIPEYDAPFCAYLAEKTGAIVVSASYRFAPRHVFPAAHQDAEDVATYLVENADNLWGANPRLLTASGFSAGCNQPLNVSQHLAGSEASVKGSVTFYNPVSHVFDSERINYMEDC